MDDSAGGLSAAAAAVAVLLKALPDAKLAWYFTVASMAVTTLEAIACFPEEVVYIWPADWGHVKILYLLARYFVYVPFVFAALLTNSQSSPSVVTCRIWVVAGSVAVFAVSTIAGTLLALRVYALTGRNRVVGIFLACLGIALHTAAYVLDVGAMNDPTLHPPSPVPLLFPCVSRRSGNAGNGVMLAYCMVLVTEVVFLGMTLWLCLTKYRASDSSLVSSLYRDGLWYFVVLSLSSVANIICYARAPAGLASLFVSPQTMLHGVISTRMVLHLRKTAARQSIAGRTSNDHGDGDGMELSEIQFDRVVGMQDSMDTDDTYVAYGIKSQNLSDCLQVREREDFMNSTTTGSTGLGR